MAEEVVFLSFQYPTLLLATAATAVDATRLDFRSILKHCRILVAAGSVSVSVPISLSFSFTSLRPLRRTYVAPSRPYRGFPSRSSGVIFAPVASSTRTNLLKKLYGNVNSRLVYI